jgi:hypothetical protein
MASSGSLRMASFPQSATQETRGFSRTSSEADTRRTAQLPWRCRLLRHCRTPARTIGPNIAHIAYSRISCRRRSQKARRASAQLQPRDRALGVERDDGDGCQFRATGLAVRITLPCGYVGAVASFHATQGPAVVTSHAPAPRSPRPGAPTSSWPYASSAAASSRDKPDIRPACYRHRPPGLSTDGRMQRPEDIPSARHL